MTQEVATVTPIASLPVVQEAAAVAIPQKPKAAAPAVARVTVIARVWELTGAIVPQLQYRIARLGAVGLAGVAALLAAATITFGALLPGQSAIRSLDADIARARRRPPVENTPEEGLGRLVGSLPTRGQIPLVIGEVLQQARQSGVPLDSGHYSFVPGKAGNIGRYELEFPVKASYPQIRDFINRTLTAVPAAGLDKLHIERRSVTEETVNADVRFVIFVRGE
jgi:hypothetical protein